jgi:hypothetical protein
MDFAAAIIRMEQRAAVAGSADFPSAHVIAAAWLDGADLYLNAPGFRPVRLGALHLGSARHRPREPRELVRVRQTGSGHAALFVEPSRDAAFARPPCEEATTPLFVLCNPDVPGAAAFAPALADVGLLVHRSLLARTVVRLVGPDREEPDPLRHLAVVWTEIAGPSSRRTAPQLLPPHEAYRRAVAFAAGSSSLVTLRASLPELLANARAGGAPLPIPLCACPAVEPHLHEALRLLPNAASRLPALPLSLRPRMCMVLGEEEGDAEDTLGRSPLTWVSLQPHHWHCAQCLADAERRSDDGSVAFTVEALAAALQASAGLRWDDSTGEVFGRHPFMVPLFVMFFVPQHDVPPGCLCGRTLTGATLANAQAVLTHGALGVEKVREAIARMNTVVDQLARVQSRPGLSEAVLNAAAALSIYLLWCTFRVSEAIRCGGEAGDVPTRCLQLQRVNLSAPVGVIARIAASTSDDDEDDEGGAAGAAESRRGSEGAPPPTAPRPWCFLCGTSPPCLHAVVVAVRRGCEDLAEALALPEVRRWREAGEAYTAAIRRLGIVPTAPQLDVAALMCHVVERATMSAIQPRCLTCDAPYTLASGCTNVRCSACNRHHCHVCDRRYASTRQPETASQLRREVDALIRDHGEAARDGQTPSLRSGSLATPSLSLRDSGALRAPRSASLQQGSAPLGLRACAVTKAADVAELYALHPSWDDALRAGIPVTTSRVFLNDRFAHTGETHEHCPLFIPYREEDRNLSSLFTEVPSSHRLEGLPGGVYVQLGRRCGAMEHAEEDVGVAFAFRLVMRMRSLAERLHHALGAGDEDHTAAPSNVGSGGLRWAWPIMMHAAGQWAEGKTAEELANAPLTPLCLLWLLGLRICNPSRPSPALPPMPTMLLRLMYSIALRTGFTCGHDGLESEQEDDDGASRFVEAEILVMSMAEPREEDPYLFTRIGMLDLAAT